MNLKEFFKRENLDEMQKQTLLKIESRGFWVLWVLLLKTGIDKVVSQMHSGKLTSSLGWPEWMFTIFLPIGAVFLVLHTIEFCVDVMADNAPCVREEGGND